MTATTGKRRTTMRAAQAAETRQRLIDAAVEAFSEQGYDEVAVADIAKAAGVAHGLLFHYFGNKRGIYLAALRDASDRIASSGARSRASYRPADPRGISRSPQLSRRTPRARAPVGSRRTKR